MLIQLQYIRGIAALLVVYFHAILQLQKLDPTATLSGAAFGESGVDLFFVLSGFVMWITTSHKTMSPTEFYAKRIRRIVPLYWSATLLAASVALVAPSLLRSTVFDISHLLSSLFFLPWINPADPLGAMVAPVIVPGWTLNYEMYFYLVFGVMLLLPKWSRLIAMFGVCTTIVLMCQFLPASNTATLFYGNLVVFEFLAGVAIGNLYLSGHRLRPSIAFSIIAIAACALIYMDHQHWPVDRLFKLGIPAAAIVYAATALDLRPFRSLPWLRYLGDASYSIYITHIFVLAGARMTYPYLPLDLLRNEVVFTASSVALSVLVGIVVHALFEIPVGRFLSRGEEQERRGAKITAAAE